MKFGPKIFVKSCLQSGVKNTACATKTATDHDGLRVERVHELPDRGSKCAAAAFNNLTCDYVAGFCARRDFARVDLLIRAKKIALRERRTRREVFKRQRRVQSV